MKTTLTCNQEGWKDEKTHLYQESDSFEGVIGFWAFVCGASIAFNAMTAHKYRMAKKKHKNKMRKKITREAVLSLHENGLTYKQIAAELDIPVPEVVQMVTNYEE